ncbi:MAG: hypothetical protein HOD43_13400 [Candidatus Marinimicrobia bacterium]|jgi:hypothetical protein|nr:hypothetical protein [Candidatus Neomarinimicrobiota bacterium]MBT3629766.1 hypothetical protein [Candidatus Neomarinimicrobiota bacterium]MBT3825648.1 hypothetical protein [Candidatus Neomarinimicrobiota bacterium]MBT4132490.1 hypothetical protein [Candidatus Neomarinimicrobiota bacterium]MBT4296789.1 hypothetical protein [Candidatus Neomarinimicrobiota bacterium]
MNTKLLVIISSGDSEVAQAGTTYAVNALKHAWMEEVKLYFFGPSEALLLTDKRLQALLMDYQNEQETAVACKMIADEDGVGEKVAALGVNVQYVGEQISTLIKNGYTPMVW